MLGLGRMGTPIAARLSAAGHEVIGWDPARPSGATAPHDVVTTEVLITVLPGPREVEDAVGPLLATLPPLWIDLTSNDPRVLQGLAARTPTDVVGAGMGGGVTAARSGSIRFFVGGSDLAVERARPVLELLGSIDHVGESVGDGMTAKLLANLLWFGQVVAVTEALLLGQSLGISPAALRATLASSAGGSVFIDEHLDRLLDGDYLADFSLARCVEELDTLAALAAGAGIPFDLSQTVVRLHHEALDRFGAIDGELLAAKLLEQRAGRDLRR